MNMHLALNRLFGDSSVYSLNECCGLADCAHLYCTKCCKDHAERSILSKCSQIECPHPNCRHIFDIDQCRTLLSKASLDILNIRKKEADLPASQRIYCPFLDCSAFIPILKSESSNSASDTFVECYSCNRGFCLECNIPWKRECDMCGAVELHKSFISTKGKFPLLLVPWPKVSLHVFKWICISLKIVFSGSSSVSFLLNECCGLADCAHEYCTKCCKKHAERKILSKCSQIECPHPNCRHNFDIDQCRTLLSEVSFDILNTRQTEGAIPISQRIYCPFQDCSVFIPVLKSESNNSASHVSVECHSCHRGFCLECNVPWESECNICAETKSHKSFISTTGELSYVIYRCFLFLGLKCPRMFSSEYVSYIKWSFWVRCIEFAHFV